MLRALTAMAARPQDQAYAASGVLCHRYRYRHRQNHGQHCAAARAACTRPHRSGHEAGRQRLRAHAAGWRNEDALALQAASNPQPAYATLNPYALPAPLAPELAAADVGVTLSLEPITQAFAQLRAQAEVVVVEASVVGPRR